MAIEIERRVNNLRLGSRMPTSGNDQKENFHQIIENTKKTCSSPDGKIHQVDAHNFDAEICVGSKFSFFISGTKNGKFSHQSINRLPNFPYNINIILCN